MSELHHIQYQGGQEEHHDPRRHAHSHRLRKIDAILGDWVDVGCIRPQSGSVVGPHTNIYPLSMIAAQFPPGMSKDKDHVVEKIVEE